VALPLLVAFLFGLGVLARTGLEFLGAINLRIKLVALLVLRPAFSKFARTRAFVLFVGLP
jgi:hypothetical protein